MERIRTKLSQEEFERAKTPSNHVAVELLRVEKDATTKGGIYMGYLDDTTWEDDNETHSADIASVVGRVVKCPQELYYNENDPHNSMPWKTEMELVEDDIVWFNLIESLNANEIEIDNKIIRIIPYSDIYVAKREIWIDKWARKKQIIIKCLNGYCLLEQVPISRVSGLDQIDHGVYNDRGIVRYFGTPNSEYINKSASDDIVIKEGEMAYIKPGYTPFPLERRTYFALFNEDKLYYCVQRRRIVMSV